MGVPPHLPDRQVLPGGWVGGPEHHVHPRVESHPVPPYNLHSRVGPQVPASSSVAVQQNSQLLLPFSRIFWYSTIICPFSETWRLRLSLPACSPRLHQPLSPPNHPLAHNSPCHELGQVLVAFDLFGLSLAPFPWASACCDEWRCTVWSKLATICIGLNKRRLYKHAKRDCSVCLMIDCC